MDELADHGGRWSGSRVVAGGLLLIGAVIAARVRLVWSVAPYAGVLDLALVVADLGTAVWLWRRDATEPRLVALFAVVVALAGHALAKTVGLPGASRLNGTPGPWESFVLFLQAAMLVLISTDLWRRRRRQRPVGLTPPRPPEGGRGTGRSWLK
jgi:hypothetical protein